MKTLKFSSRKNWTVTDFRFFLHQLNVLYNRIYVITEPRSSGASLESMLRGSHSRVPERDRLSIDHIEIRSPGKFGFSGKESLVKHLWSMLKHVSLLDLKRAEKEQGIAHQGKMNELEVKEKCIENARKLVELHKEVADLMEKAGFSVEEIQNNIGKIVDPHRNVLMMMESHEMDLLDDDEDA